MAGVSFKYWNDCVDPQDLNEMWVNPNVSREWINAGESRDAKVQLSRDPDGQFFLTQTEMRAVAGITVRRHFASLIEPDMLCAIAQLESGRQPLATQYNEKKKETTLGLMQMTLKTAEWLVGELDCPSYDIKGDPNLLYKPFINVYLGAAYLRWLSTFDQKERSEEFMVRAFKGGTKKATHKSTLPYWKRYMSVKESLPREMFEVPLLSPTSAALARAANKGVAKTWDARTSIEDMEGMWSNHKVSREWTKSGEKKGKVRLSHDTEERPYVSRIELRAVAKIILTKHFSTKGVKPNVLCAVAEVVSMRFVNGIGNRPGLMGIDYATASWLHNDLGYKGYGLKAADDLNKPFVSMYFGAAYLAWLSQYEGKERTPQFVVQAYLAGPENVDQQETSGPLWQKFQEALAKYEELKNETGSCNFL